MSELPTYLRTGVPLYVSGSCKDGRIRPKHLADQAVMLLITDERTGYIFMLSFPFGNSTFSSSIIRLTEYLPNDQYIGLQGESSVVRCQL